MGIARRTFPPSLPQFRRAVLRFWLAQADRTMSPSIPDFSGRRILVVGDVMLDRYWSGATERISPEAPVPVVHVGAAEERPGGAANVAVNLAALGAEATLLGLIGADPEGRRLVELLADFAIGNALVSREE